MNWLGNFIVENLVWVILASFVITMIGGWLIEKKEMKQSAMKQYITK